LRLSKSQRGFDEESLPMLATLSYYTYVQRQPNYLE
jgi:hypothetical protein